MTDAKDVEAEFQIFVEEMLKGAIDHGISVPGAALALLTSAVHLMYRHIGPEQTSAWIAETAIEIDRVLLTN